MTDTNYLLGIVKVAEKKSEFNGTVEVIRSLAFGTYIQVEGLTQSGGILTEVWNTVLKNVVRQKPEVFNCLVLGLGGGSVVKLVRKYWKRSEIDAVDIDPVMVQMGKKYLKLDETGVNVIINDASKFIQKSLKAKKKYDLVLIDMYVGTEVPEKFTTSDFIHDIYKITNSNGISVFNRLYYGDKRPQAVKFMNLLEKQFQEVSPIYPEANVMFVCKK